jgi:hypothetical protein
MIALPNLDDRRWADLVEEGRALIPVFGADWTDHNVHDPGITLMELLAWIAEMDIFELNQIPDRHKRKFLELIGVVPKPPVAGRTVIGIALAKNVPTLSLPAGLEFAGTDLSGTETRVRILEPITAVSGGISAMQFQDATGFHDLGTALRRGDTFQPFGPSPVLDSAFYIGLKAALPADVPVRFVFKFADGHSGWAARQRLRSEIRAQQEDCQPQPNPCGKSSAGSSAKTTLPSIPPHYGVRTVWEFLGNTANGTEWIALDADKGQVQDQTRALTLDGYVVFQVPSAMVQKSIGAVGSSYYYLRNRIVAGLHDAAPVLQSVVFNGVEAEQALPVGTSFEILRGASIQYSSSGQPKPGDMTPVQMELDSQGRITSLSFVAGKDSDPSFFVQYYQPPSATSGGHLSIEAVLLGIASGTPQQQFVLPELQPQQSSLQLDIYQNGSWQHWTQRDDFDSSTWNDYSYQLDPATGLVTFASGEKSNIPASDSEIFTRYRATRADLGNAGVGVISRLADSAHNRALLYDTSAVPDGWTSVKNQIESIKNPEPISGGAAEETVNHAAGRAITLAENTNRAVTLADYERLALATPGTRIARVTARANLHPDFPCFEAPGMITVIIVPYLPAGRPVPTPGLRQTVARYLRRRRVIGTRVEVVGPTYVEVAVSATVQAAVRVDKTALRQRILGALNHFLDPLGGGPDGNGWPFGRDVYRAEIMQVIDGVTGVDHVVSLQLITDSCEPQCGNVCLGPTWLVAAGVHQIQVV